MTKQLPSYLRLHVEPAVETAPVVVPSGDGLSRLCRSFGAATGFSLHIVKGELPKSGGPIVWSRPMQRPDSDEVWQAVVQSPEVGDAAPNVKPLSVCELAECVSELVEELQRTRHALWQREAELATAVPVVSHPQEQAHLAKRLRAILEGIAAAVEGQAAALYVLDEATSELKMRAAWGLPANRYLEAARPLRGAVADLEALTGHAVVLEDTALLPHWRVPEDFASAACVPVASSTTPLGTLWVFCDTVRDFSEHQTNLIEIVAGRIAAELEREVLISGMRESKGRDDEMVAVAHVQQRQLPQRRPAIDAWEVAGRLDCGGRLSSAFYDWRVLEDGSLAIMLADVQGTGLSGAMTSAMLHAAVRSQISPLQPPHELLASTNQTFWSMSTGDSFSNLFYGLLLPTRGKMVYGSAGKVGAMIVRSDRPTSITQGWPPLGSAPETCFHTSAQTLAVGDCLIVVSDGIRKAKNSAGEELGEATIADAVRDQMHGSADDVIEAIWRQFWGHTDGNYHNDAVLLIARRRS